MLSYLGAYYDITWDPENGDWLLIHRDFGVIKRWPGDGTYSWHRDQELQKISHALGPDATVAERERMLTELGIRDTNTEDGT